MVSELYFGLNTAAARSLQWLADVAPEPLINRLDPQRRAAVLAALFGLVLLGLFMVVAIWLGGRYVRRRSRINPPMRAPLPSDWDRKQPGSRPSGGGNGASPPEGGTPTA
jgi:hypothetical protein